MTGLNAEEINTGTINLLHAIGFSKGWEIAAIAIIGSGIVVSPSVQDFSILAGRSGEQ